jgi:hypothetical protein
MIRTFITDEKITLTLKDFYDNIEEHNEEDVTWDDFNLLCSLEGGESCRIGINWIERIF